MTDKVWKKVSIEAKNFVTRLLTHRHEERPSAEEALQDVWLSKSNEMKNRKLLNSACIAFENIINFNQFTKMKQVVYSYIIS